MKQVLSIVILIVAGCVPLLAQKEGYSVKNAHSHNDYEQRNPFYEAYEHRFGSIEADVHWVNDTLFVAHDAHEITRERTLENLYLKPLMEKYKENRGRVYEGKSARLVLLVDLKTSYKETLPLLIKTLEPYRKMLMPRGSVQIVISGNTPPATLFSSYPDYLYFDGRPEISYTSSQLKRLGMISQSFGKYSKWKGEGQLPPTDKAKLEEVIKQVHQQGKKMRFWATPDVEAAWSQMIELKVDFINTDRIKPLSDFLLM